MTEIPKPGPFCHEVDAMVCAPCPVREISEGQWQVDMRSEDATPFEVAERLKSVVHEAVHPQQGFAEAGLHPLSHSLHRVNSEILDITPENLDSDADFYPDEEGKVVLTGDKAVDTLSDEESWALDNTIVVSEDEEDFPHSARAFIACIRRNQELACMEGVRAPASPATKGDLLPPQILDLDFALDTLRAIAEDGSPDDIRTKLRELADADRPDDEINRTNKELASMTEAELRSALLSLADAIEETMKSPQTDD